MADVCCVCKVEKNNQLLEEKCCNIKICFSCIKSKRYCYTDGCVKELKRNMQEVVIERGYISNILTLNEKQNHAERKYGLTVLDTAITCNDLDMVHDILDCGLFDKNKYSIDLAIELYHLEIIRVLKDYDFPFDYQSCLQLQDDFSFLTYQEADKILRL